MMKIAPDWLHWPETHTLIAAFGERPIRFVGGCVRDAVLGRKVSDVDAATPLPPEEVMALLRKSGIKAIPTGIAHGTVTAVVGSKHFEVTTLRRDVATDGRHATVAYTDDWQEDAMRRDFTMNALYMDAEGNVSDYFGGIEDAKAGLIKFIGDPEQRIHEDALRILRFFRFFAHYGKAAIDQQGLEGCTKLAAMIETLSGERIQQEMLKLMVAGSAGPVVGLMQKAGVLTHVMPSKVQTEALTFLPALQAMAKEAHDAIVSLAALLRSAEDDKAKLVETLHARWKLSNAHRKQLHLLVTTNIQLTSIEALTKRQIRVFGKEDFIQLMLLYAAEGNDYEPVLEAITLARNWTIPVFPVSGEDLKAKGIAEGKQMGETLKMLEKQWEKDGYSTSKEALLTLVKVVPDK